MGDAENESYEYGEDSYICSIEPNYGMKTCPPGLRDSGDGFYFAPGPEYATCKPDAPDPNSGVTSFDDFFTAFVTIFLVITMEGWTEVMYLAQDAYSFWIWIFFLT